jgi:hypothetical protein
MIALEELVVAYFEILSFGLRKTTEIKSVIGVMGRVSNTGSPEYEV